MKTKTLLVPIILSLISISSNASSPGAWDEHNKEVKQKCFKVSNLIKVKPAGEIIEFSDDIGFSMLLLKGVYKFDKKTPGIEVCLFKKSDRTASVTEADKLIHP